MTRIYKFGGSILKNADDIRKICHVIEKSDIDTVSVFSAFYKVTDWILEIYNLSISGSPYQDNFDKLKQFHRKQVLDLGVVCDIDYIFTEIGDILISPHGNPEEIDRIMSFGEILSTKIISSFLKNSSLIDARQVIKTNAHFGAAEVDIEKTELALQEELKKIKPKSHVIIAGFIGSSNGKTTTLGRNGSDYSAGIVANALNAKELVIFKDVDGLFAADPKIIQNPKFIDHIGYKEIHELSHLGNKIIHPKTVDQLDFKNIPIIIRNLYNLEHSGTIVSNKDNGATKSLTQLKNIAIVSIKFNDFNLDDVLKVLLNSQEIVSISEIANNRDLAFIVKEDKMPKIKEIADSYFGKKIQKIRFKRNKAIISFVGGKLYEEVGIAGRIFSILQNNNINIYSINDSLSETRISFILDNDISDYAIKVLYAELF